MESYKIDEINLDKVPECAREYPYALVYLVNRILFGKAQEVLGEIEWGDCLEARFFGEERELHLFDTEGGKKALVVSDVEGGESISHEYELDKKYSSAGKLLRVKKYLKQDEDGQFFVALTRLQGIK